LARDDLASAERGRRVFINCPFDADYSEQLDAIVFTCVHVGFYPVTADSSGQSGRPRLERILTALSSCRYSIHDLSRCRGEGEDNLARFNMPLELGMAMAIRALSPSPEAHEYLVLVPDEQYLYQRYMSDLGGLDPQTHDGSTPRVVAEVLAWLLTAAEAPTELMPEEVVMKLPRFLEEKRSLETSWHGGQAPWSRIVATAASVAGITP
jgi:hypothetical protein